MNKKLAQQMALFRSESGVITMWGLFLVIFSVGFIGLSCELIWLESQRTRAQSAADLAASASIKFRDGQLDTHGTVVSQSQMAEDFFNFHNTAVTKDVTVKIEGEGEKITLSGRVFTDRWFSSMLTSSEGQLEDVFGASEATQCYSNPKYQPTTVYHDFSGNRMGPFRNKNWVDDSLGVRHNKYWFANGVADHKAMFTTQLGTSNEDGKRIGAFKLTFKALIYHGNEYDIDGFSISLARVHDLGGRDTYENGYEMGLSVRIRPLEQYVSIGWYGGKNVIHELLTDSNGKMVGPIQNNMPNHRGFFDRTNGRVVSYSLEVSKTGFLTIKFDNITLTAQIPEDDWETADQSDWEFAFAGRLGGRNGIWREEHIWVDDVKLEIKPACT